jgi:hypothetical protein
MIARRALPDPQAVLPAKCANGWSWSSLAAARSSTACACRGRKSIRLFYECRWNYLLIAPRRKSRSVTQRLRRGAIASRRDKFRKEARVATRLPDPRARFRIRNRAQPSAARRRIHRNPRRARIACAAAAVRPAPGRQFGRPPPMSSSSRKGDEIPGKPADLATLSGAPGGISRLPPTRRAGRPCQTPMHASRFEGSSTWSLGRRTVLSLPSTSIDEGLASTNGAKAPAATPP